MSLGGWVIVSFGWRSVHHPFKVRKMEQIKLGSTCPLHMPGCNQVQLKCTRLSGSVHGRHSISVKWFLYLWCLQAARWEAWGQVAPLHWPAAPWPAIDSNPENLEHLWPNLQKKTIRKLSAMSKSAYITQYGRNSCPLMTCFWIKILIKLNLLSQREQRGCLCFLVLLYLKYYLLYKTNFRCSYNVCLVKWGLLMPSAGHLE